MPRRSDETDIDDINAGSVDDLFTDNGGGISLLSLNADAIERYIYPRKHYSSRVVPHYSQYWGVGESALLDSDRIFRPKHLPPLYFFKQYEYMVKRIDSFRAYCKSLVSLDHVQPGDLPGLAMIGTPGIGESVWPLYPGEGLTVFLIGKTSFLHYYLARELSLKRPVIYIQAGECYIFNREHVYFSSAVPLFGEKFLHILGLVDADMNNPAPSPILYGSYPFLLMAAPPRNEHYQKWVQQRGSGLSPKFVLNPPEPDELVKASVSPLAFYLSLAHSPQSEGSARIFQIP